VEKIEIMDGLQINDQFRKYSLGPEKPKLRKLTKLPKLKSSSHLLYYRGLFEAFIYQKIYLSKKHLFDLTSVEAFWCAIFEQWLPVNFWNAHCDPLSVFLQNSSQFHCQILALSSTRATQCSP
jgi:hypothetical protein